VLWEIAWGKKPTQNSGSEKAKTPMEYKYGLQIRFDTEQAEKS
jgi:hypothetical protein